MFFFYVFQLSGLFWWRRWLSHHYPWENFNIQNQGVGCSTHHQGTCLGCHRVNAFVLFCIFKIYIFFLNMSTCNASTSTTLFGPLWFTILTLKTRNLVFKLDSPPEWLPSFSWWWYLERFPLFLGCNLTNFLNWFLSLVSKIFVFY